VPGGGVRVAHGRVGAILREGCHPSARRVAGTQPPIQEDTTQSSIRAVRALVCALAVLVATAPAAQAAQDPNQVSRELRDGVTVKGITQHLQALQAIATANGATRASGTPGFAASRDYVVGRLEAAGLDVTVQQFDFAFYRKTGPRRSRAPPTSRTPRAHGVGARGVAASPASARAGDRHAAGRAQAAHAVDVGARNDSS